MYIVGHIRPDLDCLTALWLLQRYGGLDTAAVRFVNTAAPDAATLDSAAAVVDTGRVCDPARGRFDHHQDGALPCAAALVYAELLRQQLGPPELSPMIAWLDAHDRGAPHAGAAAAREWGLVALLAGLPDEASDDQRLAWGYALLDAVALTARRRQEGRAALAGHIVYESADGLLVALRDAPRAASSAAFERGARVVVFADYAANACGATRAQEWSDLSIGDLVEAAVELALADPADPALGAELARWFRHPAGFFAGRGTGKGPSPEPITVDVRDVALALDSAWLR